MRDILNFEQPKFYALIDSRWKTVTALQVRMLMLHVAENTLKGVNLDIKIKDSEGTVGNIRPDGMLNGELQHFNLDAEYTLKLLKLQQELHKK
jgi:hypothetical protein